MADHVVELRIGGAWQDVTADVREEAPITVARGRSDWATSADPAEMTLTLNNGPSKVAGVFGRYSPRNPGSDLYGLIGRNTPVRMRVGPRRNDALALPGEDGSFLATEVGQAPAIVGDIDILIDVTPATWRPTAGEGRMQLGSVWESVDGERAWVTLIRRDGTIELRTSPDGTVASVLEFISTEAVPADAGDQVVIVHLDVDNGAGGATATFYTAPDRTTTPVQLGDPVTVTGTTSLPATTTARLAFGTLSTGTTFGTAEPFAGTVRAMEVRDGIGGALAAGLYLDGYEPEDRTATDTEGRVWTLYSGATFVDPSIRFAGEAAAWPPDWDASGANCWVPLTAAGISRRLEQGTQPFQSALYRDLSRADAVVAYYPMEEEEGATRLSSGLPNDTTFLTIAEDVAPGRFDQYAASKPLPEFGAGVAYGNAPYFTGAAAQRFAILVAPPAAGLSVERRLFTVWTSGLLRLWQVNLTPGGNLRVTVVDEESVTVDTDVMGSSINGELTMVSLWLEQRGSDVFWQLAWFAVGASGGLIMEHTIASSTYARMTGASIGSGNGLEGTGMGHAVIINDDVHSVWDIVNNSLDGWAGEYAANRLQRLADDEGLPPVRLLGVAADTEPLGPQDPRTLPELIGEAAVADMGLLGDRPDATGHQYRTRRSLYNQQPALVLDYAAGLISPPFIPTDDDQATRNTITVSRPRGSSVTVAQETGPMSVQPPPAGVGTYTHTETVNVAEDSRLLSQAGWRLHLGTVDAARYASLRLELHHPRVAPLAEEILGLTEGDVVRVVNLPPQVPPGPLDLFIEGAIEQRTIATAAIEFNCSPAEPWQVFELEHDVYGRLDTAGSALALAVDADETELIVATDPGRATWIDLDPVIDAPFSLYVGAEVVTVHAIDGVDSPQTMLVTRAAGGYNRPWPAGTRVRLAPVAVGA